MGFDFTAIDFETANHQRASPCAVGLAKVREDVIVESVTWLMRPPAGFATFHPYNVSVHGISSHDVVGAPSFGDLLPMILEFIGGDVICAHNARFDGAVLDAAAATVGFRLPRLRYVCTLRAARRCLPLPSYRLPFVAEALGLSLHHHHDAGADAYAAAQILPGLASLLGVVDLDGMMAATMTATAVTPLPSTDGPAPEADKDHPLWGRVIVFTGALSTMTRRMAHAECIDAGAMPERSVTARTNVLVIGELDPARLAPGDDISQKAQKAFRLRASGQEIEVMTEYDFLRQL